MYFSENAKIHADQEYYMLHHAVIREKKSTIELRVIFDALSQALNELSLNDCLHSGPNLNPEILTLLLQFRNKQTADRVGTFMNFSETRSYKFSSVFMEKERLKIKEIFRLKF